MPVGCLNDSSRQISLDWLHLLSGRTRPLLLWLRSSKPIVLRWIWDQVKQEYRIPLPFDRSFHWFEALIEISKFCINLKLAKPFYRVFLSWDNLRKRSWHGPNRCSMCESDEETNLHMFFQCNSSQEIWYDLVILFGFPHIVFVSVHATFQWWCSQSESRHPLLVIMIWCAWK